MRKFALSALAFASLLISACTNSSQEPPHKQTPFEYYMSSERRAELQNVLDGVGMRLAHDLLAKRIPSGTRGWDKTQPAPTNGYGMLHSVPNDGTRTDLPYVEVLVKFRGGKVHLNEGIQMLTIVKDGVYYELVGAYSMTSQSKMVKDLPDTYGWAMGTATDRMRLESKDGSTVDWDQPLDQNGSYEVKGIEGQTLSVDDIKAQDKSFITAVNGLNLNGSAWH